MKTLLAAILFAFPLLSIAAPDRNAGGSAVSRTFDYIAKGY